VSDLSVAAKAIGISEADLQTALRSGQTIAQVAKAHNVDLQKVIAALVANEQDELAADVKAGRLTQAQADQMKATLTQRITDRVNGTCHGGPDGPSHDGPGHDGPGHDGPGHDGTGHRDRGRFGPPPGAVPGSFGGNDGSTPGA